MNNLIEKFLVGSKWILTVFYAGLVAALVIYCLKFCAITIELCGHFWKMSDSDLIVAILNMIDITMVANLLKMIITGSLIQLFFPSHHRPI